MFVRHFSKNHVNSFWSRMADVKIKDMSWKDRQYAAIVKLSRKKGWDFSDSNPYFERAHIFLPRVSIKTKSQMKQELKKHGYK
tara:strand:- start:246 stop:494 length:249 start_codon:yes stop_codon:yes gene_type:complete